MQIHKKYGNINLLWLTEDMMNNLIHVVLLVTAGGFLNSIL